MDYIEQAKQHASTEPLISLSEREAIELLVILEDARESAATQTETKRIHAMVTLILDKIAERASGRSGEITALSQKLEQEAGEG